MKNNYLILLFTTFMFLSFIEKEEIISKKETTVFVCGKSKIYHKSKSHSALKRCKSGISEMTETKAKKYGKRACKCKN